MARSEVSGVSERSGVSGESGAKRSERSERVHNRRAPIGLSKIFGLSEHFTCSGI